MEDIDLLYKLRYFLGDLIENLAREHQEIVQSGTTYFILYRKMILSKNEFNKLKHNKHKLISIKEFFTASRSPLVALPLTTQSEKRNNLISVVFQIECNLQEIGDHFSFANITQFNQCLHQEEILFDLNATFHLENIQEEKQIAIIKMTAVNDARAIIQKYIDDTHRQIEDLSISIIFGKLICDMSQWNQSRLYFQHLLNDSHEEDLALIEHHIGQAHYWKGEWNEARKYYQCALNRMTQVEPASIKYSAFVLSDIGEILYRQGKYEEAEEFHQQALAIRKKYYSSEHVNIASSLENIGLIQKQRQKYHEALIFLQRALTIREKYDDCFHVAIATNLCNIGSILTEQGKYDEAFDYHQRAMSIYKKNYPLDHVYIATTLNHMGAILSQQERYDEALDTVQQAWSLQKNFYPFGHIDIVI
ncbi:unnamed protein product, partial [Rotaria sp. Silwood1]